MFQSVLYLVISILVAGVYRGMCAKKDLEIANNAFNQDVIFVVVLASVFVTINVLVFIFRTAFHLDG